MDFSLTPELHALYEEASAVGEAAAAAVDVPENSWITGHSDTFAKALAERGWLGMTWPEALGGGGRTNLERSLVFEALISQGAPVASCWFADRQIGPTLLQFGTAEQQQRWLPGIISGVDRWCIGMSEPDAGSDVASLRTRAVRDGSTRWRVNGQKIWTSGAATGDWCYLICRTDPEAPPHRGLSELVVDLHSPGVDVRPITDATGDRHFCEVHFDDVAVPAAHLVGELNGSFRQVMRQMEHERGGIDRLVSNRRLYLDCLELADVHDPLVRQEVAALESLYRVGRLLVLREVLRQAPRSFSAATKTFCTEFEQRVAAFCGEVLGPATMAFDPADPTVGRLAARAARNILYAPAYTIMGGTTQILRNIIGERVLGLPR